VASLNDLERAWLLAQLDQGTDVNKSLDQLRAEFYATAYSGNGGGGTGLYFSYSQATPSASWIVTHNLGKRPSVTVLDSAGFEVLADVEHASLNAVTITHGAAMTGSAHMVA
jgi:hypothetical protein